MSQEQLNGLCSGESGRCIKLASRVVLVLSVHYGRFKAF